MKIKVIYFFALVIVFITTSCQNDAKVVDAKTPLIVNDTVSEGAKVESSIKDVSTTPVKKVEKKAENKVEKKIEKKVEKPKEIKTSTKAVNVEKKTVVKRGEIDLKEETAEDLESEVEKKVNIVINPDNDNGNFEIKEDATIDVVPILTDADKAKYYVQFTIKVNKISKADLSKFFPDSQKIFVVQHQGLYKYCVGQFDDEEKAKAYKVKVDKEFGFKHSEVTNYSDAW